VSEPIRKTRRLAAPAPPAATAAPHAPFLLAILGLALLLRLLYLGQIRRLPFFEFPIIDGAEYLAWANSILSGGALWREVPIHGPSYAYFLAALLGSSGGSLAFVVLVQLLLGVLSAFVMFRLGRRLFGKTAGLVAAVIAAAYVPFLYFEGLILPAGLIVLLNLVVLERIAALPRNPRLREAAVPGFALGISIVAHPNALPLLVTIPAWLALAARRREAREVERARAAESARPAERPRDAAARPSSVRTALVVAAAALVVVVPVLLRNAALGGGPVFQRNTGKNFYIGMGPAADGTANVPPGTPWERLRRQAWQAGARTPAAESRVFAREALGFAARHPAAALGLVAKKAFLFVSGIHVDASQDFRFFRRNAPLLALPIPSPAIVIPLGLLGLLRVGRRAPLLVVYLATYFVSVTEFAFATRYALPAHLALIPLAAAALVHLARAARARRVAAADAGLLAVFLIASNVDPFHLRQRELLHTSGHIAKILFDAGRTDEAARAYDAAIRERPDDPDIRNGYGTLLDGIGRHDEARAQYEAAIAAAPDHSDARFNLAAQAYERRELDAAADGYRNAIAFAPWRADARLNLSVVYADKESLDRAAAELDTALVLAPRYTEAALNLATVELRRGAPDRAAAIYRRLLAEEPSGEIETHLGMALDAAGDHLGAQDSFRKALRADPADRTALFQLGMNLAGFQQFEEAIETWKRLLEIAPGEPAAQAAIAAARARLDARAAAAESTGSAGESTGAVGESTGAALGGGAPR